MDRRVVGGTIFVEYKEGVKNFYDYTFGNIALLVEGWAHCPYNRCVNKKKILINYFLFIKFISLFSYLIYN